MSAPPTKVPLNCLLSLECYANFDELRTDVQHVTLTIRPYLRPGRHDGVAQGGALRHEA